MASLSPFHLSSLMILILVMVSLFVSSTWGTLNNQFSAKEDGFRINIRHVDSNGNYSKLELLQRGMERGRHRLARLSSMATSSDDSLQTLVHSYGSFLMDIAIGTPPTSYSAFMDTGSDLIWTQCAPCVECYQQPTAIFDPNRSSSFSKLSCSSNLCKALDVSYCSDGCGYQLEYGNLATTQGVMANETFTFDQVPVPNIGFGCGNINQGNGLARASGIVGLGRGPLSLVSQLGIGKFSYCLTSIDDTKTSSLLFGYLASSVNTSGVPAVTTPIIENPSGKSFYYLSLEGITVGSTLLPIQKSAFSIKKDGSGGVIIDSGTTLTILEDTAFELVMNAFKEQINLPVLADVTENSLFCFSLPSNTSDINIPKLIFHFDGADFDLPVKNYILSPKKGEMCLAMTGSTGMSIIGNVLLQNILVLHDLDKQTISFTPTMCDQLLVSNRRNASQGTNVSAPPNSSPPNSSVHGHDESNSTRLQSKRQFPKNIVIALSALGTLILLAATIVFIICCFRWKKTKHAKAVEAFLRDHQSRPPIRYRYSTLEKITDSFQNKVGEGGFGSVFKGKLPNDGTVVAVKLLTEAKGNGDDFINEVTSISLASHTNCITLLGYCVKGSKRALIYQYMPNGSLDKYIYIDNPSEAHSHLGWPKLHNIAIGIARGLEYLHTGCNTPILHLDIKPGNILLDNEFCPVISDFGLAKLCVGRKDSVSLETARGTPGYAAPELVSKNNGRVSHKADVYSYGMMLLEMVGGRKNLIPNSTIDISEIYYPLWIYDRLILKEDLKLCGVRTVADEEVAQMMIVVGLQCIQNDPMDRPSMREVLERLEGRLETLQIPPKP